VDAVGHDRGMERVRADLVLVGGGGAAVCVLHRLALRRLDEAARGTRPRARVRVAVVDPLDRLVTTPDDRTWAFWERGRRPTPLQQVVDRTYSSLLVAGPGRSVDVDLAPAHRYHVLRSSTFYRHVRDLVADPRAGIDLVHLDGVSSGVTEDAGAVTVRTTTSRGDGVAVEAPWALSSVVRPDALAGGTTLWQHFRGVEVRTAQPAFDPDRAVLMDLRARQPRQGTGFGYVLPLGRRRALVEYTVFAPGARPSATDLQAGLDAYLAASGLADAEVLRHEEGSIPMSSARFRVREGRSRVVRIGTAGGATRASTGYTFAAMQRQADVVARALGRGLPPVPPPAYPSRHRLLDDVLLRGLSSGAIDGTEFFPLLFERNPPGLVLDFLDGLTTRRQELRLMASVPPLPMVRAVLSPSGG
jgi:lycopene beta-cyclase